jgi:hypothetical protein
MCTDFEKTIYNVFLRESRKAKSLPFRPRKDFQKINEKTILCLQKLSNFFLNNKEVDITEYFKAPYYVYPEGESFDLSFFVSQKAKSVFKIFLQSKDTKTENEVDNSI